MSEPVLRYAVIGNPVFHSKSPQIHALFAQQTGVKLSYEAVESPLDRFPHTVKAFFAFGGSGLNITLPFKEQAFALAADCSPRARLAAAANTLWLKDGELFADNTDGIGLVRDLKDNHRIPLQGQHTLILGAGGAARGVLPALIAEHPASVTLLNRTQSKAQAVVAALSPTAKKSGVTLNAHPYNDSLPQAHYPLIINATSLGLPSDSLATQGAESLPASPPSKASQPAPVASPDQAPQPNPQGGFSLLLPESIAADCCCYDMLYMDGPTPFQSWAKANGAQTAIDGLGMLIEQAAESFHLWHNTHPQTTPIITTLRGKPTH